MPVTDRLANMVYSATDDLERAVQETTLNIGWKAYNDLERVKDTAETQASRFQWVQWRHGSGDSDEPSESELADEVVDALEQLAFSAEDKMRELDDKGWLDEGDEPSDRLMELMEGFIYDLETEIDDIKGIVE